MRIATFVLSVLVVIIMLLQSCLVFGCSSISDSLSDAEEASDSTGGGAVGVLAALCAFVGMAFVLKLPVVSIVLYLLGALFAFLASTTGFSDMTIWGVALVVLAVLAFFARRELKREAKAGAAQ